MIGLRFTKCHTIRRTKLLQQSAWHLHFLRAKHTHTQENIHNQSLEDEVISNPDLRLCVVECPSKFDTLLAVSEYEADSVRKSFIPNILASTPDSYF